jgi:alpha-beta hydrolase superfamily lysophospholipase
MSPFSLASPPADDIGLMQEQLVLADSCQVPVLRHRPAQPAGPLLPVLYLHGIQSHPGWFVASAQALARSGCDVFALTRRGSGLAATARGDVRGAGQLLADVRAAVDWVLAQTGQQRLALVGVSWGGKLAVAYALTEPSRLASLTLIAPGIAARVDVPPATKLAIAACRLIWPKRLFDIPLNDPALFTDNPPMRQYMADDPHRLHRATARLLFSSAMLDRLLARARPGSLAVPTTLILAGRDRIIDNDHTRKAIDRLTAGRANVVGFDACHTIEFEPDASAFHRALCRAVRDMAVGGVETMLHHGHSAPTDP